MTLFSFLEYFQRMDRRFIFLGMGFAILLPLLFPVSLPFKIDERVQSLYDEVEKVPAGSTVLVSADFDPASRPELEPFFRANLDHLFRNDVKVVMVTLWEYAPPMVKPIFDEIAERHGKTWGEDFVFLGYKPGKELAIKFVGENLYKSFPTVQHPTDLTMVSVDTLPIMQGYKQAKDFPLLVSVSAGFPGTKEYVLQIQGQYDLNIISACTAVSAPDYVPFYKAGQLTGLSGGMPGSAQYESLVYADAVPDGVRLTATPSVNVLNCGHFYIIVLIIAGNVAWLLTRSRDVATGGKA